MAVLGMTADIGWNASTVAFSWALSVGQAEDQYCVDRSPLIGDSLWDYIQWGIE